MSIDFLFRIKTSGGYDNKIHKRNENAPQREHQNGCIERLIHEPHLISRTAIFIWLRDRLCSRIQNDSEVSLSPQLISAPTRH